MALKEGDIFARTYGDAEALQSYLRALDRISEMNGPDEAQPIMQGFLQSIGAFWSKRRQFKDARVVLASAMSIAKRHAHRVGSLRALYEIGIIASDEGELDEAETILLEVFNEARNLGDSLLEQSGLYELGVVAKKLGHYELAEVRLRDSMRLADQLGSNQGHILCLLALANLAIARLRDGQSIDVAEANESYDECLRLATQYGDYESRANALDGRITCRMILGDWNSARTDLKTLRSTVYEHSLTNKIPQIEYFERYLGRT